MSILIQGLSRVYVYIDDMLLFFDDWEEHLAQVTELLRRLSEVHLTFKLAKSRFGGATVVYLGYQLGQGYVIPMAANGTVVLDYPIPTSKKEIRRFLGMAWFDRRFCPNFAEAATPLTRLTSEAVKYKWTPECQMAFTQFKNFLTRGPVLLAPDFTKPFYLHTDASDIAFVEVLLQVKNSILHPVANHSCKCNVHQQKYSTIEKELLSIIQAIQKFDCYLLPSHYPLQIFTNYNPLAFLN